MHELLVELSHICSYRFITSQKYLFQNPSLNHAISLGASGSINAILVYSIMANPRGIILYYMIPIPAAWFGALFLGYEAYSAIQHPHDGVGHAAHLGGALIGALAFKRIIPL